MIPKTKDELDALILLHKIIHSELEISSVDKSNPKYKQVRADLDGAKNDYLHEINKLFNIGKQ